MAEQVTGGCQCGRVRYSVAIDDDEAYLCHCRMCQRATGGVFAALKSVRRADIAWSVEPDRYRSSPIAQRGFCGVCGTPLTFEYIEGSEDLDLTVGSFDDPGRFRPTGNFGVESWHVAWLDTRGLPQHRTQDNPSNSERWINAIGKRPD